MVVSAVPLMTVAELSKLFDDHTKTTLFLSAFAANTSPAVFAPPYTVFVHKKVKQMSTKKLKQAAPVDSIWARMSRTELK